LFIDSNMRFYYGVSIDRLYEITDIVMQKCISNHRIKIPTTDYERALIFTDPFYGFEKTIYITDNHNNILEFRQNDVIDLDPGIDFMSHNSAVQRLKTFHAGLKIIHGSFSDEYPEQLMVTMFLDPLSNVLEIGANLGRNSLIISTILKNSQNLVVLESDESVIKKLTENRDANQFKFQIQNAALSYRPLRQSGWLTLPSDETQLGGPYDFQDVETITYKQIEDKYQIRFDTLIADCEGALYYILKDKPGILNHIRTIITENDYSCIDHKNFVNCIFSIKGFKKIYHERGGWGPCADFFYEVWQKEI
jgi:FkbM family methyltransferase